MSELRVPQTRDPGATQPVQYLPASPGELEQRTGAPAGEQPFIRAGVARPRTKALQRVEQREPCTKSCRHQGRHAFLRQTRALLLGAVSVGGSTVLIVPSVQVSATADHTVSSVLPPARDSDARSCRYVLSSMQHSLCLARQRCPELR